MALGTQSSPVVMLVQPKGLYPHFTLLGHNENSSNLLLRTRVKPVPQQASPREPAGRGHALALAVPENLLGAWGCELDTLCTLMGTNKCHSITHKTQGWYYMTPEKEAAPSAWGWLGITSWY